MKAAELIKVLQKMKELGLLDDEPAAAPAPMSDKEVAAALVVKTPWDDMTDEEIMYYATPYYDVIQEEKKAKQERIGGEVRG